MINNALLREKEKKRKDLILKGSKIRCCQNIDTCRAFCNIALFHTNKVLNTLVRCDIQDTLSYDTIENNALDPFIVLFQCVDQITNCSFLNDLVL